VTAADSQPVSDAYAMFVRARTAVTSAAYPGRIDYTVAVSGVDGKTPIANHYRASYDPNGETIRLSSISDEELARPPVPRGVNVSVTFGICFGVCAAIKQPVGHPAPYEDLIGEPLLTPTYMFGLPLKGWANGMRAPSQEAEPWPVIATVSAQPRDYQVTLVDTQAVDGVMTYHLRLVPLRKPKENRLRELWIGEADYLPRRAVVSGNFTIAPLVDVPWTIDFSVAGGVPYIVRERAQRTLYLAHRRTVKDAIIAFVNVHEPDGTIYDEPLLTPDATDDALVEPQ
jgi:hypothetical protein